MNERAALKTIKKKYAVAVVLKDGISPLRCFVGEVQETDKMGIRMTLLDWIIGSFCGWDMFIPWENIDFAFICTPEHDLNDFIRSAADWQGRYINKPYDTKNEQTLGKNDDT